MNVILGISRSLRRKISFRKPAISSPPMVHGYLDELSESHAAGWMWRPDAPATRLAYEVILAPTNESPETGRVIAEGVADRLHPPLNDGSVGDARYGFHVSFPEKLSAQELRRLVVRPVLTNLPIERAPAFEGYLDERSIGHVAGWVRNRFDPEERVAFEVVLALPGHPQRILATGHANLLYSPLAEQSIGDGKYGFRVILQRLLSERERDAIIVRPAGAGTKLPEAPQLVTAFEPPLIQAYLDELSESHAAGWMWCPDAPATRLAYEVVLAPADESPGAGGVVAEGIADRLHPPLAGAVIGDARYGFHVSFPQKLSAQELRRLAVRPLLSNLPIERAPAFEGYVDEVGTRHVAGWVRNRFDPEERVAFEVVLALPGNSQHVLATGHADLFYLPLAQQSFGDAKYGFRVEFDHILSERERDAIIVRPAGAATKLPNSPHLVTLSEPAGRPELEGYVDERSTAHVSGWVRNRFDNTERVAFEVVVALPGTPERVIATGRADLLNLPLAQQSIGDAKYGFRITFKPSLSEQERDALIVRPLNAAEPLRLSPHLVTAFEPIDHIAIDIVNNCNLRCPFCLFDYSEVRTTRMMSPETFDGLLALLPFVRDGNFWLSCLHEPTLNPDFLGFIERIPRQWRRKVMFTTNLAKRMPAAYFASLADSGASHINISLESLDPEIFERMRKGAKWPIFKENWDRLIAAWESVSAPPRLRYIIMAYKSNRDEIPALVKYLRAERRPWQVEVRHTYNAQHIPLDFRRKEFLDDADWNWLEAQLREYSVDEVMLIPPPEGAVEMPVEPVPELAEIAQSPAQAGHVIAAMPSQCEPEPEISQHKEAIPAALKTSDDRRLTQPFNLQVDWDGKLIVYAKWDDPPELKQFAVTNINALPDAFAFLMSL